MGWENIVGLILALLIMMVGVAGSILPALPGPPLVLVAAVGHRLWLGPESIGNWGLVGLVGLTVLSLLMDWAAGLVGARKLGATWRGVLGAGIGGVVGFFAGPVGILAGPFLGATALELASGRELRDASKAGLGAFLGLLVGAVGKIACCIAMIALFVFSVALNTNS